MNIYTQRLISQQHYLNITSQFNNMQYNLVWNMRQYGQYSTNKWNSLRKMYLQAAFVTAGNPKAIVFFTAVFPQFIDPNAAYFSQFCILISICAFIAFNCFMIYAIGGQKIVSLFSKATIGKCIKRVIGSTFIGAGIGLAVSNK